MNGWGCPVCKHWNPSWANNCQNPYCKNNENQRKNNAWWQCTCHAYSYANQPYCNNCGKPKSSSCIREGRG